MATKYAEKKYAGTQYLQDVVPSGLGVSAFGELERAQFNKPYFYLGIAWGGNWTRAQNTAGALLASITSSSEFSASFPDDRVIDGIRPHKDPLVSTWNGYWKSNTATITEVAPQWLKIDLGVARIVNRIVIYHYYDSTYALDQFKVQSSDDGTAWTTRYQERNNNFTKTIIELPADVTARYWRLLIEKVSGSNYAIVQEIELYNVVNESGNINANDQGNPKFNISMRRSEDDNSLPEPTSWSVEMDNNDNRFSPLNEDSAIYGTKQVDGKGYIRSGTPVILKGGFYDADGMLRVVGIIEGQIGSEDNPASSTGIELNTSEKSATLHGKDFTNRLNLEPIPNGLPVYENYSIENLIRELGYLANVPYQDMILDTTGVTVPYAIFEQTTVLEQMEELRESIQGKLYSAQDKLYMVNQIPFRSWEQTEQTDFEAGLYSTDCFDTSTEPGKLVPKVIDTQAEWELSVTQDNVDSATTPGSIQIDSGDTEYFSVITADDTPAGAPPYTLKRAQKFTPVATGKMSGFSVYVTYLKTAAGNNITWKIIQDSGGTPSGATLFSQTFTPAELTYGVAMWHLISPSYIDLTGGQQYWIVIETTVAGSQTTVRWWGSNSATESVFQLGGSTTWSAGGRKFSIRTNVAITTATLITKTIDLGANQHPSGKIGINITLPADTAVDVYLEKKDADAGWGTQVLLGSATSGTSYQISTGTLKRYIRIQLLLKRTGNTTSTPVVSLLSWPVFFISQEHDLTALITKFGAFGANEENDNESFVYYTYAYAVSGTAWAQVSAVETYHGDPIGSTVAQYIKVGIGVNPLSPIPKILDFSVNWEIGSAITRNVLFPYSKTSEIEELFFEVGNPRCNYARVKANPYILQALSTTGVWTYNETYTLANAEVYTVNAFYPNPSIKSTGGNIRHAHVTISGTPGTVDDGSSATINGVLVEFSSGANVGTLVFTNSSGVSKTIDAVTIDSRELWSAEKSGRNNLVTSEDTASIILYGNKKFIREIDNRFIGNVASAKAIADSLVSNDKYSKVYVRNLVVSYPPSLTLQDIVVITHPEIPFSGKQTLPTELVLQGDGWRGIISSREIS